MTLQEFVDSLFKDDDRDDDYDSIYGKIWLEDIEECMGVERWKELMSHQSQKR